MAADRQCPLPPFLIELPRTGDCAFDNALRIALHHEGYYSNDADDPGGPTVYGISLRMLRGTGDTDADGWRDYDLDMDGDIDIDDLKKMTPDKVVELYRKLFWQPFPFSRLPQAIAVKLFDLTINMGSRQSFTVVQRAIRASGDDRVTEDGIMGTFTIGAINTIVRSGRQPALISAIRSEAAGFYRLLVSQKPARKRFLNGWLNRAYF